MPEALNDYIERTRALNDLGMEHERASDIAWLELQLRRWPDAWGDNIHFLVFGDFKQPTRLLEFPDIGITIYPDKIENTVASGAICTLKGTAHVSDRTIMGLNDFISRINILLGAWTLTSWGGSAFNWWSWYKPMYSGSVVADLDTLGNSDVITHILKLPADVQQRVRAALYWIRAPRKHALESARENTFQLYSGLWNAFECLIEAVMIVRPLAKHNQKQKQELVDEYLRQLGRNPTYNDIGQCYREYINPSFKVRATHAIKEAFQEYADRYVRECFSHTDKKDRLYDIRNAINHGTIDPDNMDDVYRVNSRLNILWLMVLRMFGRIFPLAVPAEDRPVDNI